MCNCYELLQVLVLAHSSLMPHSWRGIKEPWSLALPLPSWTTSSVWCAAYWYSPLSSPSRESWDRQNHKSSTLSSTTDLETQDSPLYGWFNSSLSVQLHVVYVPRLQRESVRKAPPLPKMNVFVSPRIVNNAYSFLDNTNIHSNGMNDVRTGNDSTFTSLLYMYIHMSLLQDAIALL